MKKKVSIDLLRKTDFFNKKTAELLRRNFVEVICLGYFKQISMEW